MTGLCSGDEQISQVPKPNLPAQQIECAVFDWPERLFTAPVGLLMKITDIKLSGEEEITLSDLRSRPGDIFTQVQMGKVFVVTKNGKAIATIQKPEPSARYLGSEVRRLNLCKG